ncbi:hypothetical protein [Rhodopseudomonas palustris]|uniref:hypothetical protein n=1 Tax=Rhodopseudomonas palustris TaxID=1076 RepID=UPI000D1A1A4D|nr:hypothetical protein [Rhodopseudomonas palustris]AVT83688.1 hypothetical protein RPYSC3_48280 [Rhodopseudomonas palustris]
MTATKQTQKRVPNSRFDRKQRVRNGRVIKAQVTRRDLEKTFSALNKYTFLDSSYLHAFGGGEYQSFRKHLDLLYRSGYIDRPQWQTRCPLAKYRRAIYCMDTPGIEVARSMGYEMRDRRAYRNYEHKFLEGMIFASRDLAEIEDSSIAIDDWDDIIKSGRVPPETTDRTDPFTIQVRDRVIRPDGRPFAIRYAGGGGRFCVVEADCDNESVESEKDDAIRAKIELYLEILSKRIYETHFGAKTFFVLFVTINAQQHARILRAIENVIKANKLPKSYAKFILVKWTPIFSHPIERPELGTGHILTKPWQRACGHDDINLSKPKED